MKPTRIRMCHSLVMNYGLYKQMEIFVSVMICQLQLT
jgi:histone deacetylase 1/2